METFFSGADPSISAQASVGILTRPQVVKLGVRLDTFEIMGLYVEAQGISLVTVAIAGI